MKSAIILCLALAAGSVGAQDIKVYETDKHGNKLRQTHVIEGARIYTTDQYGQRRYQTHVVRGLMIYQTDKHGNILYHKPATIVKPVP